MAVEGTLINLAANVLSSLVNFASQQIALAWGVKEELKNMEKYVSTIKSILEDAEERQVSNRAVKEWLQKLKLILYDADDLLDEVETKRRKVEIRNRLVRKVNNFFTRTNPLMVHRVKDIGHRLDEIVSQMRDFKFVVKQVGKPIETIRREETSSFVNTTVIGREDDKEKFVTLLLSSGGEEDVAIIPIVGMGGLGKTTLAQLVYNDHRIQNHFTKRFWVCISNDFDIKSILIQLLQEGGPKGDHCYSNEGLEQLQMRVTSMLSVNKFLLFLDDVWNEDRVKWKLLEDLLMRGARGSRIAITTRSKMVASIVRTRTVKPYKLGGLTEDQCLKIFVKWAFKEGHESRHQNLVNIGLEIVKKCGGVPLAARTLGSLLFLKTDEQYWLSVMNSEIWTLVQNDNDIIPILRLSFDQMPSYLKHCFAYCSLYEKDEVILGTKLIYAWMAQGYLQCLDKKEELEDKGEACILELVRRSFLEPDGLDRYKMHDLVHDLAQHVAGNECMTIKGAITEAIPDTVRHLSFGAIPDTVRHVPSDSNGHCKFSRPLINAKRLRTLFYSRKTRPTFGSFGMPEVASFRGLRVLEGCGYEEKIGKLKLLRYLSINKVNLLPKSLCKLLNLQYLDISDSQLCQLPKDFGKLINLRFLRLSTSLSCLPEKEISTLTSLRRLIIHKCMSLTSLGKGIEHLSCLRSLALVDCSELVSLPVGFRNLTSLEFLEISMCERLNLLGEDDLKGLRSLKKLKLRNLKGLVSLPEGLQDAADTLTHLEIVSCFNFTSPSESVLPNLRALQSLKIVDCNKVQSLPEGMRRLTKLQYLRIFECSLNTSTYRKGGESWPKIAHVPKIEMA